MNVPRFAPLSAALLMLGLTSCPETNVPRDFGVKPAVLKPEAWEGDWSEVENPEEKVHFAIKQADQGVLSITLHDKEKKTDSVIEAVVRHASEDKGSQLLFLVWFDKPGTTLGPLSLMSKHADNVFYLWHPRHEVIEKAIASGRLKGTVTKSKDGAHSELVPEASNYSLLTLPEFWDWTAPDAYFKHASPKAK